MILKINYWGSFQKHFIGETTLYLSKLYPKYTLHSKLFKFMFCPLNYNSCSTLHQDVKFVVNFDWKVWHHMKRFNYLSSQSLKNKWETTLTILKYTLDYTLHPKFWISIQVNRFWGLKYHNIVSKPKTIQRIEI